MKYNVVMTVGGFVSSYDGMTGEPIDLNQTECPTEVLGTFASEDEARDFIDACTWGRISLPHKEGNKSFHIELVEE